MPQVSVRDAVQAAKQALQTDLYPDDPVRALALEEIELVKENDKELWAVTLGFFRTKSVSPLPTGGLASFMQPQQVEHRVYKTLFIDAETGAFVKMDMRIVQ